MKTVLKAALGLLVLFLGARGILLYRELERASRDPWREQRLAERMVQTARESAGARYHPREVEEAYRLYWRARRIHAIQDSKPFILKDFDYTRDLYSQAFRLGLEAWRTGTATDARLREEAQAAVAQAEHLTRFAREIYKKAQMGTLLVPAIAQAEMACAEAKGFFKMREYRKASEKAGQSIRTAETALESIGGVLEKFYDPDRLRHWRGLLAGAVDYSRSTGRVVLVTIKDQRILRVYRHGKIVRTYDVELGKNPLERKLRSGDLATPEGRYIVSAKKSGRQTKYYLALLINYPNDEDKSRFAEAKRLGRIPARSHIGGLIEIHGDGGKGGDWTEGCVALKNEDMKEVFNQVEVGTPVVIIGSEGYTQTYSELRASRPWKNGKAS
jgi:lipoprotein-anchoring transpeptidase ErfK/SrfK